MHWGFILGGLVLASLTSVGSGQSIDWANSVLDDNYRSDGVTQLDDTFTFELGVFAEGFTPNDSNVNLWADNWHSLDVDSHDDSGFQEFGNTGVLNSEDPGSELNGLQVYIWGYDDKAAVTARTPGAQSVLLTNSTSWFLKDTAQLGAPQQFFVSAADTAVFGSAVLDPDGVGSGVPYTSYGGGVYAPTGDPSTYAVGWEIQTATFAGVNSDILEELFGDRSASPLMMERIPAKEGGEVQWLLKWDIEESDLSDFTIEIQTSSDFMNWERLRLFEEIGFGEHSLIHTPVEGQGRQFFRMIVTME